MSEHQGGSTLDRNLHAQRSGVLFVIGLALIILSVVSISHFVISAAMAGFPDAVLGVAYNWIFIACHAALGAGGLILTGYAYKASVHRPFLSR
ncbi:MAG: hypothetical protein GY847_15620 [Proteobacteria bacterium]|nr:hypothetical protein [Pseudomonadota bacterium]